MIDVSCAPILLSELARSSDKSTDADGKLRKLSDALSSSTNMKTIAHRSVTDNALDGCGSS